ncbi:hypothetical protein PIB30_003844 [Stylosanthes scabra]|uniref:Nudix hydrolase domain-containing protein n=1 Tax=Stylosanthes scabra TaxID=79078 RepID=A0ABU6T407_9FABA|nr:hypothetical protein [Stylosanthes scabra]
MAFSSRSHKTNLQISHKIYFTISSTASLLPLSLSIPCLVALSLTEPKTLPLIQNSSSRRVGMKIFQYVWELNPGEQPIITLSGEVALPGGKAEEGDNNDGDTAKRETMEEIGLDPQLVDVVTFLEPFFSKYLIIVVPVIGILHDRIRGRVFALNPKATSGCRTEISVKMYKASIFSYTLNTNVLQLLKNPSVRIGHCTKVPRNSNMEKLRHGYLFPEVLFIQMTLVYDMNNVFEVIMP